MLNFYLENVSIIGAILKNENQTTDIYWQLNNDGELFGSIS